MPTYTATVYITINADDKVDAEDRIYDELEPIVNGDGPFLGFAISDIEPSENDDMPDDANVSYVILGPYDDHTNLYTF